MFFFFIKYI